jgi:F-type H+-transporting ATPase subunit delta
MRASAARYAKALLDIAIAEADPVTAERDLARFVDLVHQHPDLLRVFANPVVAARAKRAVVEQLTGRLQTIAPVAKLLLLLASRGRLELTRDVLAVYRERLMEYQQVVHAEITTATPLPPERVEQLRGRLAVLTGRTVNVTTIVDQTLIGGIVTRIGSTVYDGSVATQLTKVRDRLAQRNRA